MAIIEKGVMKKSLANADYLCKMDLKLFLEFLKSAESLTWPDEQEKSL